MKSKIFGAFLNDCDSISMNTGAKKIIRPFTKIFFIDRAVVKINNSSISTSDLMQAVFCSLPALKAMEADTMTLQPTY